MRAPVVASAMPVFLLQRMLVGVVVGATITPSAAAGQAQASVLALLFIALAAWIAIQRPFLVPARRFFAEHFFFSDQTCECISLILVSPKSTTTGCQFF